MNLRSDYAGVGTEMGTVHTGERALARRAGLNAREPKEASRPRGYDGVV